MKKAILGVILGLLVAVPASAELRKYKFYLHAVDDTTATQPSGVSTMVVGGERHSRGDNKATIAVGRSDKSYSIQVDPSAVTRTTTEAAKGGTVAHQDATAWTLRVKFSTTDSANYWSGASPYDVAYNTLSGNSVYMINLDDVITNTPLAQFMRLEWVTGSTAFAQGEVFLLVNEVRDN